MSKNRKNELYWWEVKTVDAVGSAEDGWEYNATFHKGFIHSSGATAQVIGQAVAKLMRGIHGQIGVPKQPKRNRDWVWKYENNGDYWELRHRKTGLLYISVDLVSEAYVLYYAGKITTAEFNKRIAL